MRGTSSSRSQGHHTRQMFIPIAGLGEGVNSPSHLSSPVTSSPTDPHIPQQGTVRGPSGPSDPGSWRSCWAGAARRAGRAPLSACPTQLVRNNMLL